MSVSSVRKSLQVVHEERSDAPGASNNYEQTGILFEMVKSPHLEGDQRDNFFNAKNLVCSNVTETLTQQQIIEKLEAENKKLKEEHAKKDKTIEEKDTTINEQNQKLKAAEEEKWEIVRELSETKMSNDELVRDFQKRAEDDDNEEAIVSAEEPNLPQAEDLTVPQQPLQEQPKVPNPVCRGSVVNSVFEWFKKRGIRIGDPTVPQQPLQGQPIVLNPVGRVRTVKTVFEWFNEGLSRIGRFFRENIILIGAITSGVCLITSKILDLTGHPIACIVAAGLTGAGAVVVAGAALYDRRNNVPGISNNSRKKKLA